MGEQPYLVLAYDRRWSDTESGKAIGWVTRRYLPAELAQVQERILETRVTPKMAIDHEIFTLVAQPRNRTPDSRDGDILLTELADGYDLAIGTPTEKYVRRHQDMIQHGDESWLSQTLPPTTIMTPEQSLDAALDATGKAYSVMADVVWYVGRNPDRSYFLALRALSSKVYTYLIPYGALAAVCSQIQQMTPHPERWWIHGGAR